MTIWDAALTEARKLYFDACDSTFAINLAFGINRTMLIKS